MKKIILFAAALFLAITAANAQEGTTTSAKNTGTIQVNVILNPIQTLFVNPVHKNVNLVYTTVENYKDGVNSDQLDHLTVYSTGGFAIKVESSENKITRVNGTETIESSTLSVQASPGTNNPLKSIIQGATGVKLSTTPASLFSHGTGGVDLAFNVKYSGIGANTYVNSYFKNETPTVYTTIVTYSIEAL